MQKQVGQASVQLPQLRHLDATSSQRAAPWLSAISSRRPVCGHGAAHPLRRPGDGGPGALDGAVAGRGTCGTPASTAAPAGVPMSTMNECRSPSASSVSARSYPGPAAGPVPMDVQKQVSPGSVQFTATMSTPLPARGVPRVALPAAEHLVLDLDCPQVARPDPEERQPGRRHVVRG